MLTVEGVKKELELIMQRSLNWEQLLVTTPGAVALLANSKDDFVLLVQEPPGDWLHRRHPDSVKASEQVIRRFIRFSSVRRCAYLDYLRTKLKRK